MYRVSVDGAVYRNISSPQNVQVTLIHSQTWEREQSCYEQNRYWQHLWLQSQQRCCKEDWLQAEESWDCWVVLFPIDYPLEISKWGLKTINQDHQSQSPSRGRNFQGMLDPHRSSLKRRQCTGLGAIRAPWIQTFLSGKLVGDDWSSLYKWRPKGSQWLWMDKGGNLWKSNDPSTLQEVSFNAINKYGLNTGVGLSEASWGWGVFPNPLVFKLWDPAQLIGCIPGLVLLLCQEALLMDIPKESQHRGEQKEGGSSSLATLQGL